MPTESDVFCNVICDADPVSDVILTQNNQLEQQLLFLVIQGTSDDASETQMEKGFRKARSKAGRKGTERGSAPYPVL